MYEHWGGVPERTACDNPETGVVKHPREGGEVVLNDACEALGEHYMTAIIPAQVRKPKQKASAEGTVRDAATWAMAQLRNEAFATIGDARAAVRRCLDAYSAHPFQKREDSRDSVFAEAEAAELRPLPDVRYDVCERAYDRSVNLDLHVACARNRYSVPHRYVGRKADLRVGESTPSIYHAGERIATHPLLPSYVRNAYSTDESHMPEAFARPEWDDARIRGWARKVGPSCAEVVDRIFARVKVREQAYSPALSVLRLSKKYGDERLEAACAHALPRLTSPRYRQIKAILDSSLEEGPPHGAAVRDGSRPSGHVRGADYHGELG
ncbi:MAG: Mu transposase domain-containing protein [Atopobiaceae bacterium]